MFVHVWLSLPDVEENLVYNSLYPGNKELFHALLNFTDFQVRQCNLLMLQFGKAMHLHSSDNTNIITGLKKLRDRFSILNSTIKLLEMYFLDIYESNRIEPHSAEKISTFIIFIQNPTLPTTHKVKTNNGSLNDFLIWLLEKRDTNLLYISRLCFQKYYGTNTWFEDSQIDCLYYLLFENEENGSSRQVI